MVSAISSECKSSPFLFSLCTKTLGASWCKTFALAPNTKHILVSLISWVDFSSHSLSLHLHHLPAIAHHTALSPEVSLQAISLKFLRLLETGWASKVCTTFYHGADHILLQSITCLSTPQGQSHPCLSLCPVHRETAYMFTEDLHHILLPNLLLLPHLGLISPNCRHLSASTYHSFLQFHLMINGKILSLSETYPSVHSGRFCCLGNLAFPLLVSCLYCPAFLVLCYKGGWTAFKSTFKSGIIPWMTLLLYVCLFVFVVVWDRVSSCNSGWPGIHYID